ncbi:MAG TPA: hypothetical protein VGB97_02760 [Candidatus Paceibacterota bacterium]|jgi:hypothetical protein
MKSFEGQTPRQEQLQVPVPDNRAFSLKLEQYHLLRDAHPEELERIAKLAGKSPEAFVEMMEKAAEKGRQDLEERKERITQLEQHNREYRKLPDEVRMDLIQWRPTEEDLQKAEADEKVAYDLFDKGDSSKADELFRSSMLVKFKSEFAELCKENTMEDALRALDQREYEMLRQTNIPYLSNAVRDAMRQVHQWVENKRRAYRHRHRNQAGEHGPTGPSERFEIDTHKRSPTSGRSPHRLNDEHEGW